jgi:hypothetical protein
MYDNLKTPVGLGEFFGTVYWSSNESGSSDAWSQNFDTGTQAAIGKMTSDIGFRAIRAFD